MRRTEALQGVRMAVFLNILSRWESAELNQEEAAEPLGVSERTFRRWTRRYEEEGEAGLLDRRLGKASGRRVPVDRAEEVERLYRERYQGFTVKHFHEHLVKDHGFGWGYTWTKLHLQWMGVVGKAPRKGAHRRKRERRPLAGIMLHQDGSRHAWLEGFVQARERNSNDQDCHLKHVLRKGRVSKNVEPVESEDGHCPILVTTGLGIVVHDSYELSAYPQIHGQSFA